MTTYRFRFRFHIAHKGLIKGARKKLEFILPNGISAAMHSIDADNFSEATKFVFLSGGYTSKAMALKYGFRIKDAVLCYGTKFRVGVDIGKDKANGVLSKFIKDNIFNKNGLKMIDDVHGVTAYSEDHPTSCASISAVGLVNAKDADFFTEQICNLLNINAKIDAQIKLAMELMASSFFESSPRTRFLALILAAESILKPDYRSPEVKKLVDDLKEITKTAGISKNEKSSILGSLNWLYRDSISKSLRKMASNYLSEKNIVVSHPINL